jgi:hypothetical protein
MNVNEFLFILGFLLVAWSLRELVRTWRSPKFKQDLQRLREQRRRRKATRR